MAWQVIQGDCIEILKKYPDNTFDSVVTDPPYALSFMGKAWDSFGNGKGFQAWCEDWARECLRVLKPGGYLLAFGATRTYHRETCAIEDAGFEIRDSLHWIYGSGMPKSHNVSKAIDKAAGAEREVIGKYVLPETGKVHADFSTDRNRSTYGGFSMCKDTRDITAPATDAAKQWDGWGTALKPAHEPIVMARKPLARKHTVAANVLEYGTGCINIDGCRIAGEVPTTIQGQSSHQCDIYGVDQRHQKVFIPNDSGRWPPNVIFSYDAAEELGRQSGNRKSAYPNHPETAAAYAGAEVIDGNGVTGISFGGTKAGLSYSDSGGASRFFPCFKYQAKAPMSERPVVEGIPPHPTVKPVALMRWLVRLVTPPGGKVLDLFGGTGTTAEACELEGFDCTLIERDNGSVAMINKRMAPYLDNAA